MRSDHDTINAASALLLGDQAFCLVRFPSEEKFVIFANPTLHKPENTDCFVVKPWEKSEFPTYYFSGLVPSPDQNLKIEKPAIQADTSKAEYNSNFNIYQKAFAASSLKKAILSRIVNVERPSEFDPLQYFKKLSATYPKACVYLMLHPEAGLWTGASPETLVQKSEGFYQTVSLAGTQTFAEKAVWPKKEMREQALVSQHIRETLKNFGMEDLQEAGPETYRAGNVVHLRTVFRFRGKAFQNNIDRLLEALHPTPAIAGYPVADSLDLIFKTERHDRHLYTGYLGRSNINGELDFYVNLRCMQIFENVLSVYVGGGITKASKVDGEWQETSDKAHTLLALIHD